MINCHEFMWLSWGSNSWILTANCAVEPGVLVYLVPPVSCPRDTLPRGRKSPPLPLKMTNIDNLHDVKIPFLVARLKGQKPILVVPWLSGFRMLIFSALTRSSAHCCGFKPNPGHVRQAKFCLQVVRWFSLGISHFHPSLQLIRLKMSEIILTAVKPK